MGNKENARKRVGQKKLGPAQRLIEKRRACDRERQRKCRAKKNAHVLASLVESSNIIDDVPAREIRRGAQRILESIDETLQEFPNVESRGRVMQRVWSHSSSSTNLLSSSFSLSVEGRVQRDIVSGLQQSLSEVKSAKTAAQLATKHAILTAVVTSATTASLRGQARLLNIHPRNISMAIARRNVMESISSIFKWTLSIRKKRIDVLSESTKATIALWWASETRNSPNRKEVVRQRISVGTYDEKPAQYLMETQMEFFLRFQKAFPEVIVGKRSFDLLRPFWVKRMKERNVCCCIYHVEIQELLIGLNNMRLKSGLHASALCQCDCEEVCSPFEVSGSGCQGEHATYSGTTVLWESIVCPKDEFSEWHARDCMFGQCENCGVEYLPLCPVEEVGTSAAKVYWKRFEMRTIVTKKGAEKQQLFLAYKSTSSVELIDYLKPKLQFFVQHNFVARWQDQQFKKSLANIPADSIVSVIDFAENYSFEVQNEVQSMHWQNYQVSILVQICWTRNPNPDPTDPSTNNLMKYHFYISDDKKHDSYFVQHCLNLHWKDLHQSGFYPKQHWIWSDGCSSQFKSKIPWYYVSRYPYLTGGCVCLWNFFGSGHGKGPHDGAGAVVKRYIREAQKDPLGPELANAEQVVNLLREKLSSRPETSYTGTNKSDVTRKFWYLSEVTLVIERETPYMCMPIAGTRDLHQIRSVNAMSINRLSTKSLSCFCTFCLDCKWNQCENLAWTLGWKVEVLIPDNAAYVRGAISTNFDGSAWRDYGSDGEVLAACIEMGENFATNAEEDNDENVDFELLMCTKPTFTVQEPFTCSWGQTFQKDDLCIAGLYYQTYSRDTRNYVLLRQSKTAYLHACQVRAIKFPMEPQDYRVSGNDMVYRLPDHAESGIRSALASLL